MKYFILLMVCAALGSCDSASTSTPVSDQGVDNPFLFSNNWIYQKTDYDSSGAVLSVTLDTLTVTLSYDDGSFVVDHIDYFQRVDSGFLFSGGPGNPLWYKFPAQVGDTMSVSSEFMTKAGGRVFSGRFIGTVQGVNTPVTVPAGSFLTYKYYLDIVDSSGFTAGRMIMYFSPRIGLVKDEYHEVGSSFELPLQLKWTRELSTYKIR